MGEKQRVALGRALIKKPKLLLLDEPLSNLDTQLRLELRAEIKKLHKKLSITTIYVTHDQAEAMALGEKICIINNGTVQQISTLEEIYKKPVNIFVASFLGIPTMNFVPNRWFKYERFDRKNYTIGIRPEDIKITPQGHISAIVKDIEMSGHEKYVKLYCSEETLTACVNSDIPINLHEKVNIELPVDKLHLFDTTGQRVLIEEVR